MKIGKTAEPPSSANGAREVAPALALARTALIFRREQMGGGTA